MTKSYFLYVWLPKWNCYFPDKIYRSLSYARKKGLSYGGDFFIKCSPYPFASNDESTFYFGNCLHKDDLPRDVLSFVS